MQRIALPSPGIGTLSAPVATLESPASRTVRIRLETLRYLFDNPTVDPLTGSYDGLSGVDHLALALKRHWGSNTPEVKSVEWVVPREEATEQNQAAIQSAIQGWCSAQAAITENALLVMAKERRHAWQVGGLFFAACFIVSAALDRAHALSELGGALLSESFIIAGWVSIWYPINLTLYEWWPLRRRLKLLEGTARLNVKLLDVMQY